jgi:hypothetical protein
VAGQPSVVTSVLRLDKLGRSEDSTSRLGLRHTYIAVRAWDVLDVGSSNLLLLLLLLRRRRR